MADFGERLAELIQERNVAPKQLAQSIGVNVSSIYQWRNGKLQIYLPKLIKLADYFCCSLDFLAGRTEEYTPYQGKECPSFPQRVRAVLEEKGVSTYRLRKETPIDGGYFYKWDRGSDPHILTLIELADYLDVTLDYLVGREK